MISLAEGYASLSLARHCRMSATMSGCWMDLIKFRDQPLQGNKLCTCVLKTTPSMNLWAEYFLIGIFIHLLNDTANIELAPKWLSHRPTTVLYDSCSFSFSTAEIS